MPKPAVVKPLRWHDYHGVREEAIRYCRLCHRTVKKRGWAEHLRSSMHRSAERLILR